jgi:hypothetical protein
MMDQRRGLTGKRVGGLALMLLGVAMIGYGTHFLTINGNCSSTGYLPTGPAPKCSGLEAVYILFTFFLGPLVALIGWGMAGMSGVMWPATCIGIGAGMITIWRTQDAPYGEKAFGLLVGVAFVALAVLSVGVTIRNRRRKKAAGSAPAVSPAPAGRSGPGLPGPGLPGPAAATAPALATHVPGAYPPAQYPLDDIAKLAALRDSGALTNEEFERAKARLLSQM